MGLRVKIDSKDVISKLNAMKTSSVESLQDITQTCAINTMHVSQAQLDNGNNNNSGKLRSSHNIVNNVLQNQSISILSVGQGALNQDGQPYLRYFYYGTGVKSPFGSGKGWLTSRPSDDAMAKYGLVRYGKYFRLLGQKPHPFFENAYADTLTSNIDESKFKYYESIKRGL